MRVINGIEVLTTIEELTEPSQTAVIVIDVVNVVVEKICSYEGAETPKATANADNLKAVIPPTKRLLDAAREKGVLITYAEFIQRSRYGVSMMNGPNIFCHRDADEVNEIVEGTWEARTVDELAPRDGDIVITKSRGSAFYHTELDDVLRARGIRSLILTGVLSSGCVLFTACDTMQHGYYPVIPRECVATYTPEDHRRAMGWMETKFAVYDLEEILNAWSPTAAPAQSS